MWGNQKKTRIEKIYDDLKFYSSYPDRKDAMRFIKQGAIDESYPYFSDDLLADILIFIINNNLKFKSAIDDANKLFEVIVFNKDDVEQKNIFLKLFYQYELNDKTPRNFQYFSHICSLFENKQLLLNLYSKLSLYHKKNYNVVMMIFDYIEEARKYYVDETAFYSSIMKLINRIEEAAFNKDKVEELIASNLELDKKIAGVYDIDEKKLESIPIKIGDAVNRYQDLEKKQFEINDKLKEAEDYICQVFESIDSCKKENEIINRKTLEEIKKMTQEVKDIINSFKSGVSNQTSIESSSKLDILIDQLVKINDRTLLSTSSITQSIDNKEQNEKVPLKEENNKSNSNKFNDLYITNLITNIKNDIIRTYNFTFGSDVIEIDYKFMNYIKGSYDCNTLDSIDKLKNNEGVYNFLMGYYFALYNDNWKYFELVNSKYDISKIDFIIFDKKITDKFREDEYTYLLFNKMDLLIEFALDDNIDNLKVILEINKDFELPFNYDTSKKVIEVFGIDVVINMKKSLYNSILFLIRNYGSITGTLEKLKILYDINPDFELFDTRVLTIPESIFFKDEVAHFTDIQQEGCCKLFNCRKYSEIDAEEIEIIRSLILYGSHTYLNFYVLGLLKNNEFDIDINQYIQLDYEKSEKLIDTYCLYNNTKDGIKYIKVKRKRLKLVRKTLRETTTDTIEN